MNLPIDTCENGTCAFAIRIGQDKHTYPKNIGTGGSHFPATAVIVIWEI